MIFRPFLIAAFAFLALAGSASAQFGQSYSEGQCGGSYTGQDHASYPCAATRKPICQQWNGRCQCLARKACGAKEDEEW